MEEIIKLLKEGYAIQFKPAGSYSSDLFRVTIVHVETDKRKEKTITFEAAEDLLFMKDVIQRTKPL